MYYELKNLSETNEYNIGENRTKELKYFCLQYPEWESERRRLMSTVVASRTIRTSSEGSIEWADPTSAVAQKVSEYDRKMQLVDCICKACSPDLSSYIFETVTRGVTYTMLLCTCNIPCSRSSYYRLLRKFFWMLDKVKE